MKFGGLSAPVSFILRNFSSRPSIPLLRITSFFKPMNVSFSRVRQPSFPFFSPDLGQPRPSWERAAASHASYSRREAATIRRFDAPTWPKWKKPVSSWALPFLLYPRFLHRAALENAHGYLSLFLSIFLHGFLSTSFLSACICLPCFRSRRKRRYRVGEYARACMILRDQIYLACPPYRFPLPITYS